MESRGRPRSFDRDKVLEQALGLFWEQGYLGTTYTDICAATGLSKPSLYAAFGNKETTFLAALDLYSDRYVRPGAETLEREPDACAALRNLLIATVDGLTAKGVPPGCMIAVNAACSDAPEVPEAISEALRSAAAQTRLAIATRLDRALADAQLPPGTDIDALTCLYDTLIAGLSGLAKQGAAKQDLMKAVDTAMSVWPSQRKDLGSAKNSF